MNCVSKYTFLLFRVVILKFNVICEYLTEVLVQYQQLLESGVARDKIISNTRLFRILISIAHPWFKGFTL